MDAIMQSEVFTWVILPILIFISRIFDQSIGTLRMIFVSKGLKVLAPLLAFFESIIWLVAVSQIMKHLDNVMCYVAYGGGFAMGNYIGILLDEKLSIGDVIIRLIIKEQNEALVEKLISMNHGITLIDGEGSQGKVKILLSIIHRKDVKAFIAEVKQVNPDIFYSIEEVKAVKDGIFKKSKKNYLRTSVLGAKKVK
jgi:uncharacterized protein YebE (UPF0316 family)